MASAFPDLGELDLDQTLENPRPWAPKDLVVQRTEPREADVVAILDMSLSMTGEKIALIALAVAILHLRLEHLAVVHFDTQAHRLIGLDEQLDIREVVRRVLEVPARGYTNIEAGLRLALDELGRSHRRERAGVIMTDGIANTGGDPITLARRYPRLHVVQIGEEEQRGARLCDRMARAGHGGHYLAEDYSGLPRTVRRLVREVFRA